jgi:F-box-like
MKADPALFPFLKSNDPLPDHLLAHLNVYLDHRAQRIQFCRDEAARLRREADNLEHESRRLEFQRSTYIPLRNPIRRVPPEILAKIMHWVLGGPGCFVDQQGRVEFLRLRQVARSWRFTASSTPYLWRFLGIDIEDFSGIAASPSVVLVTLARRLDWWFGHAGRNAEVHLDLGIDPYPWLERVNWMGCLWGPNARPFRLVTAQLWGHLILGSDVTEEYPSMENLKNLSIGESISGVERKFPMLESLKLSFRSIEDTLEPPIRHSKLTSLFLSHLSLDDASFAPILSNLPLLDELIMDSCFYDRGLWLHGVPLVANTSLRRLVAPSSVLSRLKNFSFPCLQLCRIIQNTISDFLLRWQPVDDDDDLSFIAGFLQQCNAPNLTLDLARANINPADIHVLLSPIPSLRSIRFATTDAIFTDDALRWRAKPNAKYIVCERFLTIPDKFQVTPWVRPSWSKMVTVYIPSDPNAIKQSHFLCAEMAGVKQLSAMHFVCLPESQMTSVLLDEFPIRNHEYEALWNQLAP